MGTNKRYADKIDRRVAARTDEIVARPQDWSHILVSPNVWIIAHGGTGVAWATTAKLGYRRETFTLAYLRTGELVGYFTTIEKATDAVRRHLHPGNDKTRPKGVCVALHSHRFCSPGQRDDLEGQR